MRWDRWGWELPFWVLWVVGFGGGRRGRDTFGSVPGCGVVGGYSGSLCYTIYIGTRVGLGEMLVLHVEACCVVLLFVTVVYLHSFRTLVEWNLAAGSTNTVPRTAVQSYIAEEFQVVLVSTTRQRTRCRMQTSAPTLASVLEPNLTSLSVQAPKDPRVLNFSCYIEFSKRKTTGCIYRTAIAI